MAFPGTQQSVSHTTFKPALDELYKKLQKHSVCTNIHLFKIQNRKIFWGGGHPLPTPHLIGAFGTSIFAPSALKLGVPRVFFKETTPE